MDGRGDELALLQVKGAELQWTRPRIPLLFSKASIMPTVRLKIRIHCFFKTTKLRTRTFIQIRREEVSLVVPRSAPATCCSKHRGRLEGWGGSKGGTRGVGWVQGVGTRGVGWVQGKLILPIHTRCNLFPVFRAHAWGFGRAP